MQVLQQRAAMYKHTASQLDVLLVGQFYFRKRLDESKSPRVRLQRLEKCLDQKVTMVRQQSTGSTA